MKKYIYLLFIVLAFSACYYDNNSELHPGAGLNTICDTVDVTYTKTIGHIYTSYCVNGNCHNSTFQAGQVVLDSYAFAVATDDGDLIAAIEHTGPYPMPNDGSKLSDCNINQIKIWIQNGKPE